MRLSILHTVIAVGLALGARQAQAASQVFAHYMVGNVTEEHIRQDIIDAAAAGISGFSLNIGKPGADFVVNTLRYMFTHAYENGFYIHISMDLIESGDENGGHPELFNDLIRGYVGHSGYYQVDGKPFITTFSDGGLTNKEWDAWKLNTLANKLYFCPDFDGTPGYNTSADGWWDYWGDSVDCVFSWDAAWQRRGPEYAGSESPGSIEIDNAVIEDAKAKGKGYMMGAFAMPFYNPSADQFAQGSAHCSTRAPMSTRPDYICVITWNDGPESHYVGNIWPEQNTDPDPARYVTSAKEWSHKAWLPLIHSFSDAFMSGGGPSSMSVPYGNQASAIGVMWYKSVLQSTSCPNGDHPDGWELGADQLNWAVVVDPGTDTSGWVLRAFNGQETIEHRAFKSGLNYGAFVLADGTPHMTLSTGNANYIAWGARPVTTDCPDGIFNMNDVVVGLDSEACFGAADALTTAQVSCLCFYHETR
ncbi:glycosyl hydrolase family 71-domain-containing protein [Schizophyllum fasciatum]